MDLLKLPDFEMQELNSCKSRQAKHFHPCYNRVRSKSKSLDRRRRVLWIGIALHRIGHSDWHIFETEAEQRSSGESAERSSCVPPRKLERMERTKPVSRLPKRTDGRQR